MRRLISSGILIVILAAMLVVMPAQAMIIGGGGGGGSDVQISSYTHDLSTCCDGPAGSAVVTYAFQTSPDWMSQGYDWVTVRIQTWVSLTAQYAGTDAYISRKDGLWWYTNVFHESNVAIAHNIHGATPYVDDAWDKKINPYGTKYRLYSKLHVGDPFLQDAYDERCSYVTPARTQS